jgi:uncharacterized protein YodC (DUF2158 family)
MIEPLKPGDIVSLKSGGPDMTVDAVEQLNGQDKAICFWFAEAQAHKATFAVTSLESLEPATALDHPRRREPGPAAAPRPRRAASPQLAAE